VKEMRSYEFDLDEESARIHQRTIDALSRMGHQILSDKLCALKVRRVDADYRFPEIAPEEAETALMLAEDIHLGLDSL